MPAPDVAPPDRILVYRSPGETRTALMAGDELVSIVHRRDGALQAEGVYFARIGLPAPHMPAVFVDLGGETPGLLKIKPPFPAKGAGVAVAVIVPERADKGAEVKLAPDVPVPADGGAGALLRAAPEPAAVWWGAYGAAIAAIACAPQSEAARLTRLLGPGAPVTGHRGAADLFAVHGVDDAIEAALDKTVPLPCGGSLIIETTAAVIAIDVNAGPADPDTANGEALAAVARELRRRNLAGHIVVDVIPTRRRAALPRLLVERLAHDPAPARVAGLTPLGMIELTRQRLGASLAETLLDEDGCSTVPSVAYRLLRDAVRFAFTAKAAHVAAEAAPEVIAALTTGLAPALREAEEAIKGEIRLTARPGLARARFDLRPA